MTLLALVLWVVIIYVAVMVKINNDIKVIAPHHTEQG